MVPFVRKFWNTSFFTNVITYSCVLSLLSETFKGSAGIPCRWQGKFFNGLNYIVLSGNPVLPAMYRIWYYESDIFSGIYRDCLFNDCSGG
jgi:hypothetical protein